MMKIYAKDQTLQKFLKSKQLTNTLIVDNPKDSEYMITGRYSNDIYHEGLKGIIIPYTGHNGINLEDMRKKRLKLFVTPIRSKYTAEKAVTLTLALLGNTVNYHNRLCKGDWAERNTDDRIPWVSIQKKSIGLFGYGRIGKLIHEMLKGFQCNFYTIKRNKVYKKINLVKDLKELINVCDIVIISVPLNSETENIFNDVILQKMSNKYLINVGRGKVVNQEALYKALKNNVLRGYASDVWYNYPKGQEKLFPSD